jgi:hypothetical protein
MGDGGVCVGKKSGNFVLHGGAAAGGRRRAWRRRMYVVLACFDGAFCEEERFVRPATVMD